ncbi:MAG: ABC transporter permease [Caulobacterales bacterium]
MFRSYLAAALRNLARNGLYTGVTVAGLAIAFAAAILIALFVRDELGYDRFIPGYRQVYRISETNRFGGGQTLRGDVTQKRRLAGDLALAFRGVQATARLFWSPAELRGRPGDALVSDQDFAWADPELFKVLPLPAIAGDPATALQQPDGLVLTRSRARQYFGRDAPLGATLQVNGHPMRVAAVLADLPSETHLSTQVFASTRAAFSDAQHDAGWAPYTYVRLRPGVSSAELNQVLGRIAAVYSAEEPSAGNRARYEFTAVPLADIHLTPAGQNSPSAKLPGDRRAIAAIAVVGALVVLVASLNFVTLVTARSARRAVEVGVRKVAGAGRGDLMVQFMGEALILVALAMLLAMAIAEVLLRPLDAFLRRGMAFDYLRDPAVLAAIAAATVIVGVLAGAYPALVLSRFRPAETLGGGGLVFSPGSGRARQVLVAVQFAVFIGLVVMSVTIYRQTMLALHEGLAAQKAPILLINTPCAGALPEAVGALPGVTAAACSSEAGGTFTESVGISRVKTPGGDLSFVMAPVDFGFLDLYGLSPVAGRLFDRRFGEDGVMARADTRLQPSVVINESAVHALGFSSSRAAVGRAMTWTRFPPPPRTPQVAASQIIGVVRDTHRSVRDAAQPTFYYVDPTKNGLLSVRLDGRDTPGAMRAIQQLWPRLGDGHALRARLLSQVRQAEYQDVLLEGAALGVSSALALFIACLGLFALSVFTTERRTKEIGVRKALGADTPAILRLLLWQFTQPVLWANLVAWPLALLAARRWLGGFAYHVALSPLTFVLGGALAVLIAWVTVGVQAWLVARARPAAALRYE